MEVQEFERILNTTIDLKLAPITLKIEHIQGRVDRVIESSKWVIAVIMIPTILFVLGKVIS